MPDDARSIETLIYTYAELVDQGDIEGVATLLASLRAAGAEQQAAALTGRLSAVGMFWLFLKEQKGLADQFHFGREADGIPAAPWGWEDLDLSFSEQAIPAQH